MTTAADPEVTRVACISLRRMAKREGKESRGECSTKPYNRIHSMYMVYAILLSSQKSLNRERHLQK